MKKGCAISIIALGVLLVLCVGVAAIGILLLSRPATQLLVLISSPQSGERAVVGQETLVHAVARGDQKIKRVELWVDGKLYDAQSSPSLGGISPFPVVINWRPESSGSHSLVVRAFNVQNGRASAAISIDAIQNQDRDGDGVLDSLDRCPDQAGPALNGGCPAVTSNDRDGDGIADGIDRCPDQPGSLVAQGCPDADHDTVPDSADACPREPGSPQNNGCPTPGDADSDGVPDASDACPGEPGSADLRGCSENPGDAVSDRDRDGVADPQDLCPDVAGPASNSGCPPTGTGDRDGDGVDDGTDLAPTEAGSAADGGAPPPGGDTDTDGDDIPDDEEAAGSPEDPIPDGGSWAAINVVRIDALEFSTTQDYEHVYCYVTAPDVAERYGPFDLIGTHQWNIADYAGGANSRGIGVEVGHTLDLHIECAGHYPSTGAFSIVPADLGAITRSYAENQWDGHVITERSGMAVAERGDAGHSFEVKFRLCLRSCESSEFPPPALHRQDIRIGPLPPREYLAWSWSGDEHNITGYRIYINGNRHASVAAAQPNRVRFDLYDPPCGESYQYYVTAYRANADGFNARESPPSNVVTAQGETCPRRVQIKFDRIYLGPNFPDDYGLDGGPYYGNFWAEGSTRQQLDWRTGECKTFLWTYTCKTGWDYRVEGRILQMFDGIRNSSPELSGWNMYAPSTDTVTIQLGQHDDLTIGTNVMDEDAFGHDDRMMGATTTIAAGSILPTDITLRTGNNWVIVRIQMVEGE